MKENMKEKENMLNRLNLLNRLIDFTCENFK